MTDTVKYYYANGKRIAMRRNGGLSYIFSDHLGGTSVVLDTTTGMTSTVTYFPYGSTRAGSVPTDYNFTGQRLDPTGLYDYGARFYDPALGRFISPDSVVPAGANPQDLNRYSYTWNNPLRYVDPSGHGVDVANTLERVRLCGRGGCGISGGGGGRPPQVPPVAPKLPDPKPTTAETGRASGKGTPDSPADAAATDGAMGRTAQSRAAEGESETPRGGAGPKGPVDEEIGEIRGTGRTRSTESADEGNRGHADWFVDYRLQSPSTRETNRTVKDPLTRKTIMNPDGIYDRRRPDGVDYGTGEVAEYKTGKWSEQAETQAWEQAQAYADLLNDAYGYIDFFRPQVYWRDHE